MRRAHDGAERRRERRCACRAASMGSWPEGAMLAHGARPPSRRSRTVSDWSDREVDRQGDGARQAGSHADDVPHEYRACTVRTQGQEVHVEPRDHSCVASREKYDEPVFYSARRAGLSRRAIKRSRRSRAGTRRLATEGPLPTQAPVQSAQIDGCGRSEALKRRRAKPLSKLVPYDRIRP